jgi:hypothetical protein
MIVVREPGRMTADQRAEQRSGGLQVKDRSVGARTLRRRNPDLHSRTVIKVRSHFCTHASSRTSRRATRVLVNGESFAVFEAGGDILETPAEPLGFSIAIHATSAVSS